MLLLLSVLACNGEPGGLDAGFARVRLPAPIGLPTAGGKASTVGESTPLSDLRPGSTRIYGHPDIKALVLSREPGQLAIIVRMDTWAIFPGLRDQVVAALGGATMPGLFDNLILVASRTWSGPARYASGGDWVTGNADTHNPAIQQAIVEAVTEAIGIAWVSRVRSELGTGAVDIDGGFEDWRCEDGDQPGNGTTPIIAVRRDGELLAVLAAYPVQGAVLTPEDLTLSQDVGGAIETAVADFIDDPAEVMVLPSWAGDRGPAHPDGNEQVGANRPSGYDQLDAIGQIVGSGIASGIDSLTWTEAPEISLRTVRMPADRDTLGYRNIDFPYSDGAWDCQGSNDCVTTTPVDLLDHACSPFASTEPAPGVATLTVGQIGGLSVVTIPAGPTTGFAEALERRLRDGANDELMVIGYAQDHFGTAMLEEDWWYGGPETVDTVWGPRQGPFLLDAAESAYLGWADDKPVEGELPATSTPLAEIADPMVAGTAVDPGIIAQQPLDVGPSDTAKVTVQGSDPWYGPPLARLETASGNRVTHPNGRAIDSDGMGFWVDVRANPTVAIDPDATERTWYWTFTLAPRHKVPTGFDLPPGDYRFAITVPLEDGTSTKVTSDAFSFTE